MAGEKILVIDDKAESVELLAEYLLRPNHYVPLIARDGEHGLQMVRDQHPDLIVLDQKMPKKSGLEVLRELREQMIDTPVILMTAFGTESVIIEALRLGACDYITKPFSIDQMLKAIQKGLGNKRTQRNRDHAWDDLQTWVKRLGSLHGTSSDKVLNLIVESAVQVTQAEEGYLLLLDDASNELYLRAEKNLDDQVARTLRVRVDDSMAGHVLQTGKPVLSNPLEDQQQFRVKTGYLVHSMINVPLRTNDHIIGVLGLANKLRSEFFTLADVELASSLADYAAIAIENAQLFDQIRDTLDRRMRELNAIHDLNREFNSTPGVDRVVGLVLDHLVRTVDAEAGMIGLFNNDDARWVSRGYLTEFIRQTPASQWGKGVIERAIKTKQPVLLPDVSTNAGWPGIPARTASALIVPIVRQKKTVGLICLHSSQPYAFDNNSLRFASSLADYVLVALENAQLWNDVVEGQRKIETVLNSMADGVFTIDCQTRIQSWNRAAERITGWSEDEVLGRYCNDILCDQDRSSLCEPNKGCPLLTALQSDKATLISGVEHIIRHRDGRQVIVALSVAPLADHTGQVSGAVSVFRDISSERMLERSKGEFISMVSHQLRSPLTIIMASAELLADPGLDDELKAGMVEEVQAKCDLLAKFVQNIIDIVELESGKGSVKNQPVPLDEVLQGQLAVFEMAHPERRLVLKLPDQLAPVRGDRIKIATVLDKLLDNAVKYSAQNTPIVVQVSIAPQNATIRVIDQGVGISPEQQEHLFTRFYRGDGSDTQQVYGAGLGLYTAKKFVELQGGEISVQSQLGQGSCFSFTLPWWDESSYRELA
ncbi:MAG: GAF domain-containing protein [Anaerolineae bacterium]|nr:GAF domain-containing protein [Anaerolineae bacterium]